MNERKLFNEWYGYDTKVTAVQKFTSLAHTELLDDLGNSSASRFVCLMPVSVAEAIIELFPNGSEARKHVTWSWRPAADGHTNEDFINWMKTLDPEKISETQYMESPWYIKDKLRLGSSFFTEMLSFFTPNQSRSDKLFRLIEMNEFIERGDEVQSFRNFLETDTEYASKCKNLSLNEVSHRSTMNLSHLLMWSAPRVFKFNSQVGQKTRDLFLPLNKSELLKVLDFHHNPVSKSNAQKSMTFDWVKLFIQSALGEYKRPEIKTLSLFDIKNYFLYKIMENWKTYRNEHRQVDANTMKSVCETIQNVNLKDDALRIISHFINTGALDNLSPVELIAVLMGCKKHTYWIEDSKGKSPLEIFTEHMTDGDFDSITACKFIAYIIINNKQPVSVTEDFDWSVIKDAPLEWSYLVTPNTKLYKRTEPIKIIEELKRIHA